MIEYSKNYLIWNCHVLFLIQRTNDVNRQAVGLQADQLE